MLHQQNVENIDQLLNELDEQSRSDLPTAQFFANLLHRVRLLVEAEGVSVLIPTAGSWVAVATSGNLENSVLSDLTAKYGELAAPTIESLVGTVKKTHWFALPIRPANFSKGCLLVSFARLLPSASIPGLLELLAAFAELLALRQMTDLESFFDYRWDRLQQLCAALGKSKSSVEGGKLLVNQLVPLLDAARVSLATTGALGRLNSEAISGVTTIDHRSRSVQTLKQFARQAMVASKPVTRQQKPSAAPEGSTIEAVLDDGAFANLLSVPLGSGGDVRSSSALVIEWQTYDEMVGAAAMVANALPTLSVAWNHHRRWQRIPRFVRYLSERGLGFSVWRGRALRWALVAALAYFAYFGLMRPYPLTIEAEGVLEPAVLQTVFANLDGYAEDLLVEDGQVVSAGQPLLRLRSPELDLRVEELTGELRTSREKRNALQIAGNQLNPDAPDLLLSQNRIAADIKQIDAQEESLTSQLKMIEVERQKATITAPIQGVVVAKDLKQQISARPLRRGDALFRIVDLEGPWHLRIQVADKDSGYVLRSRKPDEQQSLQFVIDSLPGEQFAANVDWVSSTVQNQYGAGCYVEMHAKVDEAIVDRTHMGASVRAYFKCGDQPLWFVWCRPLVEAIQRRFWFWS